jgi:hypothetical protein
MALPEPAVGLVISYSYLWREEAEAGHTEGRKNRPCAIVLSVRESEGQAPTVAVVPITHSRPKNPEAAVEIPLTVKRHLGLDDEPSWVILDEFNVFAWPGFDLRPVPGHPNRFHYGFLPPKLFTTIISRFKELRRTGRVGFTSRDE